MSSDITVFYEATPNPQSMKFISTVALLPVGEEARAFNSATEALASPLAAKLFGFPWAAGVFIGANFVTVTKQEWVDWDILADPLSELIKEHLRMGEPILASAVAATDESETAEKDDSPVVRRIKEVLRTEIRPAVAMDGGDIRFDRFENGRVYLEMRGACSGCPSSSYTLKEGIETRLRAAIPEVLEVVAV